MWTGCFQRNIIPEKKYVKSFVSAQLRANRQGLHAQHMTVRKSAESFQILQQQACRWAETLFERLTANVKDGAGEKGIKRRPRKRKWDIQRRESKGSDGGGGKWEGQKITGWKSEREPDKQQKMRGGNLRRTARRAALVSTSPALQAGGGEPVERSKTIKKRWIAIFPSTQGLLREEQKESERGGGGGGKEKPAYFSPAGLQASELQRRSPAEVDPETLPSTSSSDGLCELTYNRSFEMRLGSCLSCRASHQTCFFSL